MLVSCGHGEVDGGGTEVRVLVVEDESRIREFTSNGLAAEGIATQGARSGAEAVDGSLSARRTTS
jgi:DNA-binding response OmpR family regulator